MQQVVVEPLSELDDLKTKLELPGLIDTLSQAATQPLIAILFDPINSHRICEDYADIMAAVEVPVLTLGLINNLSPSEAEEFCTVTPTGAIVASYKSTANELAMSIERRIFVFIGDQFTGKERAEIDDYSSILRGVKWEDIPIFTQEATSASILPDLRRRGVLKFLSRGTKCLAMCDFTALKDNCLWMPDLEKIESVMGDGLGYKYYDDWKRALPLPHQRFEPLVDYLHNLKCVTDNLLELTVSLLHAKQDPDFILSDLSFPKLEKLRLVNVTEVTNINVPNCTEIIYKVQECTDPIVPHSINSLDAPKLKQLEFVNGDREEIFVTNFNVGNSIPKVAFFSKHIHPGINTPARNYTFLEQAEAITCSSATCLWEDLNLKNLQSLNVQFQSHPVTKRAHVILPSTFTHLAWLHLERMLYDEGRLVLDEMSFPPSITIDNVLIELTPDYNFLDLKLLEPIAGKVIVDYKGMCYDPLDSDRHYWVWDIAGGESYDSFVDKLNTVMYGDLKSNAENGHSDLDESTEFGDNPRNGSGDVLNEKLLGLKWTDLGLGEPPARKNKDFRVSSVNYKVLT